MVATARIKEPASKSRPLSDISGSAAPTNGPDREEFLFMTGQIAKADAVLKEARDAKKRLRNHFKLRGVDLEMMDKAIAEKELQDGTTVDNLRTFKRYCEFLGLPIGSQMQLFDAPQGNGLSQESLLKRAHDDGYERGVMGKNTDDQAYQPISPEGQEHLKGWNAGQKVNHDKFVQLSESMAAAETAKAEKKAKKPAKDEEKPPLN